MSTNEVYKLARLAPTLPRWRWRPGLRVRLRDEETPYVVVGENDDSDYIYIQPVGTMAIPFPVAAGALQLDLDAPETGGVLLDWLAGAVLTVNVGCNDGKWSVSMLGISGGPAPTLAAACVKTASLSFVGGWPKRDSSDGEEE